MKFGYFDDINKEYVINTPYTPYPWINYLGSDDYFVLFQIRVVGIVFIEMLSKTYYTRFVITISQLIQKVDFSTLKNKIPFGILVKDQ